MSLDGAKFICLDEAGDQTQVIEAKGRKFTVGYYVNCDFLIQDERAKGVHCEITSDAFGRVTIYNMSEHPIKLNEEMVSKKRPLLNGTQLTILDKKFLWEFPKTASSEYEDLPGAEVATPQKHIPEQPPNSCPNVLEHPKLPKRFTVHNFAYCIQSSEEGNTSLETEAPESTCEEKTETEETAPSSSKEATTTEMRRSITPEPKETSVSTGLETPKMNLINCTKNKENASTEKKLKLLSLCHQSDVVITSFSPRETGVRIEKSFTAIVKPSTPRSVYSTPKSVLSEYNDDEHSQDFIHFSTPATSKKSGLARLAANSSMHLIDLTTPSKLRPASPYPKSVLKASAKKNLEKASGSQKLCKPALEELGVSALPGTPTQNSTLLHKTPNTASSVISVESTDASSVIELSADDATPPILTATSKSKTPNKCVGNNAKGATTPLRTPQSLVKRAILTSAKKQAMTSGRLAAPNTPLTPKTPATGNVFASANRQCLTTPARKSLASSTRLQLDSPTTTSASTSRAASSSLLGSGLRTLTTSTPRQSMGMAGKLRTTCKTSPLRKVSKTVGNNTSHISKVRRSIALAKTRLSPTGSSLKQAAKARQSLSSLRARSIVAAVTSTPAATTTTSILKDVQSMRKENNAKKAVLFAESKTTKDELNSTFSLDSDEEENVAASKVGDGIETPKDATFSPIKSAGEEKLQSSSSTPQTEQDLQTLEATFSPVKPDSEENKFDVELNRTFSPVKEVKDVEKPTEVVADKMSNKPDEEASTEEADNVVIAESFAEIYNELNDEEDSNQENEKSVNEIASVEAHGERELKNTTCTDKEDTKLEENVEIETPTTSVKHEVVQQTNTLEALENTETLQEKTETVEVSEKSKLTDKSEEATTVENVQKSSQLAEEDTKDIVTPKENEDEKVTATTSAEKELKNLNNDDITQNLTTPAKDVNLPYSGESEETALLLEEIDYVLNKSDELKRKSLNSSNELEQSHSENQTENNEIPESLKKAEKDREETKAVNLEEKLENPVEDEVGERESALQDIVSKGQQLKNQVEGETKNDVNETTQEKSMTEVDEQENVAVKEQLLEKQAEAEATKDIKETTKQINTAKVGEKEKALKDTAAKEQKLEIQTIDETLHDINETKQQKSTTEIDENESLLEDIASKEQQNLTIPELADADALAKDDATEGTTPLPAQEKESIDDDEKENKVTETLSLKEDIAAAKTPNLRAGLRTPKSTVAVAAAEAATPRFAGLRKLMRTPKPDSKLDDSTALEGVSTLLQTPVAAKKTIGTAVATPSEELPSTFTPRRSARRASMSAEVSSVKTYTPKRSTRRASLSTDESFSLLTPKRIATRRPSLSLDDAASVSSLTTSQLRTPRRGVKILTLLEESTENMGEIIEEETTEENVKETEKCAPTDTPKSVQIEAKKTEVKEKSMTVATEVIEESICEVVSVSEVDEETTAAVEDTTQNVVKNNAESAVESEETQTSADIKTIEIHEIEDDSLCEIVEDITAPLETTDSVVMLTEKIAQKEATILDESDYEYGKEVTEIKDCDNEKKSNVATLENQAMTPKQTLKKSVKIAEAPSPKTPLMVGMREMLQTPKTNVNKTPKLFGLRDLVRTPKEVAGAQTSANDDDDDSKLLGLEELVKTPKTELKEEEPCTSASVAKSEFLGMRELLQTPKGSSTPRMHGLREMMQTPKVTSTPLLGGIKELMDVEEITGDKTITCASVVETKREHKLLKAEPNNKSELNLEEEQESDDEDECLDKFFTTPRAKNAMIPNLPASVVLEKSADSVELLQPTEYENLNATNAERMEDIFKTPTSTRFDVQDDVEDDDEIVCETPQVEKAVAKTNATLSPEEAFDELIGQASTITTPAKSVYTHKSLASTSSAQQSPFSASDVISDLPKTDIEEWVDSLEEGNFEDDAPPAEEIEVTLEANTTALGDSAVDPLIGGAVEESATKPSATKNLENTANKSESSINTSTLSNATAGADPLTCSIMKPSSKLPAVTEEVVYILDSDADMSGIDLLDQTAEESELSEPLVVSDTETLNETIESEIIKKGTSVASKAVVNSNEETEVLSDDFLETLELSDSDSSPVKFEAKTKLTQLNVTTSDVVKPAIRSEFENFKENAIVLQKRSATPNQHKVRARFSRKTLGAQEDLQLTIDFDEEKSKLMQEKLRSVEEAQVTCEETKPTTCEVITEEAQVEIQEISAEVTKEELQTEGTEQVSVEKTEIPSLERSSAEVTVSLTEEQGTIEADTAVVAELKSEKSAAATEIASSEEETVPLTEELEAAESKDETVISEEDTAPLTEELEVAESKDKTAIPEEETVPLTDELEVVKSKNEIVISEEQTAPLTEELEVAESKDETVIPEEENVQLTEELEVVKSKDVTANLEKETVSLTKEPDTAVVVKSKKEEEAVITETVSSEEETVPLTDVAVVAESKDETKAASSEKEAAKTETSEEETEELEVIVSKDQAEAPKSSSEDDIVPREDLDAALVESKNEKSGLLQEQSKNEKETAKTETASSEKETAPLTEELDVAVAAELKDEEAAKTETASSEEETAPLTEELDVAVVAESKDETKSASSEEETAPLTEETAPLTEETDPLTEETAPLTEETDPLTEETDPLTEETAPLTEELDTADANGSKEEEKAEHSAPKTEVQDKAVLEKDVSSEMEDVNPIDEKLEMVIETEKSGNERVKGTTNAETSEEIITTISQSNELDIKMPDSTSHAEPIPELAVAAEETNDLKSHVTSTVEVAENKSVSEETVTAIEETTDSEELEKKIAEITSSTEPTEASEMNASKESKKLIKEETELAQQEVVDTVASTSVVAQKAKELLILKETSEVELISVTEAPAIEPLQKENDKTTNDVEISEITLPKRRTRKGSQSSQCSSDGELPRRKTNRRKVAATTVVATPIIEEENQAEMSAQSCEANTTEVVKKDEKSNENETEVEICAVNVQVTTDESAQTLEHKPSSSRPAEQPNETVKQFEETDKTGENKAANKNSNSTVETESKQNEKTSEQLEEAGTRKPEIELAVAPIEKPTGESSKVEEAEIQPTENKTEKKTHKRRKHKDSESSECSTHETDVPKRKKLGNTLEEVVEEAQKDDNKQREATKVINIEVKIADTKNNDTLEAENESNDASKVTTATSSETKIKDSDDDNKPSSSKVVTKGHATEQKKGSEEKLEVPAETNAEKPAVEVVLKPLQHTTRRATSQDSTDEPKHVVAERKEVEKPVEGVEEIESQKTNKAEQIEEVVTAENNTEAIVEVVPISAETLATRVRTSKRRVRKASQASQSSEASTNDIDMPQSTKTVSVLEEVAEEIEQEKVSEIANAENLKKAQEEPAAIIEIADDSDGPEPEAVEPKENKSSKPETSELTTKVEEEKPAKAEGSKPLKRATRKASNQDSSTHATKRRIGQRKNVKNALEELEEAKEIEIIDLEEDTNAKIDNSHDKKDTKSIPEQTLQVRENTGVLPEAEQTVANDADVLVVTKVTNPLADVVEVVEVLDTVVDVSDAESTENELSKKLDSRAHGRKRKNEESEAAIVEPQPEEHASTSTLSRKRGRKNSVDVKEGLATGEDSHEAEVESNKKQVEAEMAEETKDDATSIRGRKLGRKNTTDSKEDIEIGEDSHEAKIDSNTEQTGDKHVSPETIEETKRDPQPAKHATSSTRSRRRGGKNTTDPKEDIVTGEDSHEAEVESNKEQAKNKQTQEVIAEETKEEKRPVELATTSTRNRRRGRKNTADAKEDIVTGEDSHEAEVESNKEQAEDKVPQQEIAEETKEEPQPVELATTTTRRRGLKNIADIKEDIVISEDPHEAEVELNKEIAEETTNENSANNKPTEDKAVVADDAKSTISVAENEQESVVTVTTTRRGRVVRSKRKDEHVTADSMDQEKETRRVHKKASDEDESTNSTADQKEETADQAVKIDVKRATTKRRGGRKVKDETTIKQNETVDMHAELGTTETEQIEEKLNDEVEHKKESSEGDEHIVATTKEKKIKATAAKRGTRAPRGKKVTKEPEKPVEGAVTVAETKEDSETVTPSNELEAKAAATEAEPKTPQRRARKASGADSAARGAPKTPPTPTRRVPRRAATAQERNYDESSDTETQLKRPSEAERATTSRGRTRKPTAKVQQFLEEERAKAVTPKRRLLAAAAAVGATDSPTPQKQPARRGHNPSNAETDGASTPSLLPGKRGGRGKGEVPSESLEQSHAVVDLAITSETEETQSSHTEEKPPSKGRARGGSRKTKRVETAEADEPPNKKSTQMLAPDDISITSGSHQAESPPVEEDTATPAAAKEPLPAKRVRNRRLPSKTLELESEQEEEKPKTTRRARAQKPKATPKESQAVEESDARADDEDDDEEPLAQVAVKAAATKRTAARKATATTASLTTTDAPAKKRSRRKAVEDVVEGAIEEANDAVAPTNKRGGRKVVRFEPANEVAAENVAIAEDVPAAVEAAPTPPVKRATRTRRK